MSERRERKEKLWPPSLCWRVMAPQNRFCTEGEGRQGREEWRHPISQLLCHICIHGIYNCGYIYGIPYAFANTLVCMPARLMPYILQFCPMYHTIQHASSLVTGSPSFLLPICVPAILITQISCLPFEMSDMQHGREMTAEKENEERSHGMLSYLYS